MVKYFGEVIFMDWSKLSKGKTIALIVFYAIGYQLIFSLLPYFITPLFVNLGFPENNVLDLINLLFQILALYIAVYICKDVLSKDWKVFKKNWKNIFKSVLVLYLFMYVINYVLAIGLLYIGSKSANQEQLIELINKVPLSYNFMAVIVAPIIEELVFRVALFRNTYEKSKFGAYFFSSLIFGLLHVISSIFAGNFIDSLYIVVYINMAMFMARAYEKHKTIFASILYHFINNLIAVILLEVFKYVSV